LELVNFETLDQFSYSFSEIRGFILFNQILLSLFGISIAFHNSIWLNIKTKNVSNSIKNLNTVEFEFSAGFCCVVPLLCFHNTLIMTNFDDLKYIK